MGLYVYVNIMQLNTVVCVLISVVMCVKICILWDIIFAVVYSVKKFLLISLFFNIEFSLVAMYLSFLWWGIMRWPHLEVRLNVILQMVEILSDCNIHKTSFHNYAN